MIRLLRTEKRHWPGRGTTRGQGTGSLKGPLPQSPCPTRRGSSHTVTPPHQFSCLRQEEAQEPVVSYKGSAQEHHSQVKRSNRTSRGVTRTQTAQVLLTKERVQAWVFPLVMSSAKG